MFLTENLKTNKDIFDLIIFDIDGVLIDTRMSYSKAVVDAVSICIKETGIKVSKSYLHNLYNEIKQHSGFNDDWVCAETLYAFVLIKTKGIDFKFSDFLRIYKTNHNINSLFQKLNKYIILNIQEKIINNITTSNVTKIAKELYAGQLCNKIYCSEFSGLAKTGFHLNEKIIVDITLLDNLPLLKGVYTGRNLGEMNLALKKIKCTSWDTDILFYDKEKTESWKKPSAEPLITAINKKRSRGIIFAGDSPDDIKAFYNLKRKKPYICAEFVLVANNINDFTNSDNFSKVNNINQLLRYFL